MALLAFTSANGSPGVTTTALGLALSWPRPVVLVDADPTGAHAIPAGYFRGAQLPTSATIVDLAIAHRQGQLAEALPRMLMPIPESNVQYLAGPQKHSQARGLTALWEPLTAALKGLERNGQDVIVDTGRLGLEGFPMTLFTNADLALLVTRSTLPSLVAAASWAETLREIFDRIGATSSLASAVIGTGQPYRPAVITKTLGLPVAATIAADADAAAVFTYGHQPPRKFERSDLVKSLRTTAHTLQARLQSARAELGEWTDWEQDEGGAA